MFSPLIHVVREETKGGGLLGNMILDRRGHQPREVVDSENLIRRFVLFGFRMMASFNQLHRWGAVVSSPSLVSVHTTHFQGPHVQSGHGSNLCSQVLGLRVSGLGPQAPFFWFSQVVRFPDPQMRTC